jgi:hypothetical protein
MDDVEGEAGEDDKIKDEADDDDDDFVEDSQAVVTPPKPRRKSSSSKESSADRVARLHPEIEGGKEPDATEDLWKAHLYQCLCPPLLLTPTHTHTHACLLFQSLEAVG